MKRVIEWLLLTFTLTGSIYSLSCMNDYGIKMAIFILGGLVSLSLDSLYRDGL